MLSAAAKAGCMQLPLTSIASLLKASMLYRCNRKQRDWELTAWVNLASAAGPPGPVHSSAGQNGHLQDSVRSLS